ncbi:MAG: alcohol dehydrogenase catalytic domain-containing protein [Spirochaetota bacterium]
MENKIVLIRKPKRADVIVQRIPEIADNEVLIKVMANGICGTDVHIFEGSYMGQYPIVPGHEFSGIVEKAGKYVTRIKKGDRVAVEPNIACDNCWYCLNNEQNFCDNWQAIGVTLPGGMAQYVTVPEKAVFSIGSIPFSVGAFMEPLSCVLHGIEKLEIKPGQRILIIGAGPIGMLLLQIAQIKGSTEATVIDTNSKRAEFAEKFGATATSSSLKEVNGSAFDVVIDATGVPDVMGKSIHFARKGGKVLLFGVPPQGKTY